MGGPAAAESSLRQGRGVTSSSKIQFGTSPSCTQPPEQLSTIRYTARQRAGESDYFSKILSSSNYQPLPRLKSLDPSQMAEPTPVFDPPVLENGTSAVEAEGSATTTDNGTLKENNGQDVTMAGLEESGVKTSKTAGDPTVSVYHWLCTRPLLCSIHLHRIHNHTQSRSHSPQ